MTACVSEEYQELSVGEEVDLEALLTRDNAIQDAAAFTENLSEELAHLDQVNRLPPPPLTLTLSAGQHQSSNGVRGRDI